MSGTAREHAQPSQPGRITLTGLRVRGHHGVLAHEREHGQQFIIDCALDLDIAHAAADDDLTATINYAEVAHTITTVVAGPPYDLIETLVVRIADAVLAEQPLAQQVHLTVHKPQAPIPADFADVSVSITRSRK